MWISVVSIASSLSRQPLDKRRSWPNSGELDYAVRSFRILTILAFALLCMPGTIVSAQGVSDRVVVANVEAAVVVDGKAVDTVVRGQVFKVYGVDGPRLWVRHRRAGWLEKRHVMPLGQPAVEYFSSLIAASPESSDAHHARGNVWGHRGQLNKAIADFTTAIRLDPNRSASFINRGLAQHHQGNFTKAIADYDQAIRIDASNPIAFSNRGWAKQVKGDLDSAIEDYNEAIRLDAKYAFAYSNRAVIRMATGDYGEAIEDLDRALELDPKNAIDFNNRAWIRATCPVSKYRDGKKAINDAEQACELIGWDKVRLMGTLAAAYAEGGDFKRAVKWIRKAMKADLDNSSTQRKEMLESFRAGKPFRDPQSKNER